MKASVVDLRYKMKEVLQALRRNEKVEILYHGKTAGTIIPAPSRHNYQKASDHPFFGFSKASHSRRAIEKTMDKLRGGRYRDL